MNICFISKYPPIEGGVSAQTYWLARALGKRGHNVHIVTNAGEVESEYRMDIDTDDAGFSPENINVHNLFGDTDVLLIPKSKTYCERLANLAIKIITEYEIEIIDSRFFIPYGVSGYLAASLTNKPFVLRHAGSDLFRLYSLSDYSYLISGILDSSVKIISDDSGKSKLKSSGFSEDKIIPMGPTPVNRDFFNAKAELFDFQELFADFKKEIPTIFFAGKIPFYWKSKGLEELFRTLSLINEPFQLVILGNGQGLSEVKKMNELIGLSNKTYFMNFVPPWKMPSILRSVSCVLLPEYNFPVAEHISSVLLETIAVRTPVIISEELFKKHSIPPCSDDEIHVIDPENVKQFKSVLEKVIKGDKRDNLSPDVSDNYEFESYVKQTELVYQQLL